MLTVVDQTFQNVLTSSVKTAQSQFFKWKQFPVHILVAGIPISNAAKFAQSRRTW